MADGTRLSSPTAVNSRVNVRQQIVALRDQLNLLLDCDAIDDKESEQVCLLQQITDCISSVKYELEGMRIVRNLQVKFETEHPKEIRIRNIISSTGAQIYGQALRNYFHDHNATTQIDKMIIYGSLGLEQLQDAELILKVIRETPNLKKFSMWCSHIESDGNDTLSAKMIASAFLESAAANRNIETIEIGLLLQEFDEMICLVMEQSQSLKVLKLSGSFFHEDGLPDLQRYKTNISKAFHNNRSLKVLQLSGWKFAHELNKPFSMFANAIKLSQSIQRLEIEACDLDLASTKDLKDLITCRNPQMSTTASSFESLSLDSFSTYECEPEIEYNDFQFILQHEQQQEATAQSSGKTLLCAATALREIRLECRPVDDESKCVSQLLSTFQNTTATISVKSILLYSMTPKPCAQVIQNLPTLRTLKRLGLNYVGNFSRRLYTGADIAACKLVVDENLQSLVHAFRQNCSLEEITTDESVGLSLEQSNTVKLFGQRNQWLQKWKNDTTMPHDYYLYCALKSCLDYEFKFEIIMSLLKKYWLKNAGEKLVCHLKKEEE